MTLREYMKAAQIYGAFDGFTLDVQLGERELKEKLGRYLAFPCGDNGFCINLLSKIPKRDIKSWVEKSTAIDGSMLKLFTERADQWSPHFIPGIGTIVRYSPTLLETFRVSEESYGYAKIAIPDFAFEIAWMLDSGTLSRLDLEQNLSDIYFHLKEILEENTSILANTREPKTPETPEQGESEKLGFPPEYIRGNPNTLAYLQWQIQGVAERLVLQHGPERRAEYFAEYSAPQVLGEYTSALDEIDSDEDALGDLFG
jgi:hypothetical protein